MWLDWRKTVDLYLGKSMAMLKIGTQNPIVLEFPSTLPLQMILERLNSPLIKIISQSTKRRFPKQAIRVVTSGALCPVVAFDIPKGVSQWLEIEKIAHATAALAMGMPVEKISCNIAIPQHRLAGAIPNTLLDTVNEWAVSHDLLMISCRPLWSVVSNAPLVRQKSNLGFCLQERDGLTAMIVDKNAVFVRYFPVNKDSDVGVAQYNDWRSTLGFRGAQVSLITFESSRSPPNFRMPNEWRNHWGIVHAKT